MIDIVVAEGMVLIVDRRMQSLAFTDNIAYV